MRPNQDWSHLLNWRDRVPPKLSFVAAPEPPIFERRTCAFNPEHRFTVRVGSTATHCGPACTGAAARQRLRAGRS